MESKDMEILVGFLLYFVANFFVATFLTGIAAMIGGFFGVLGTIAIVLGSSIVSFPVLVLTFWAAHKAGIGASIPQTE